ncbi:MAG: hypothetical protein V3U65_19880 [Granulosicoccaceae bacterium]
MDTIYIEQRVSEHPRTLAIVARYPKARIIPIERYNEVFNNASQNFRKQKQNPALILAQKEGERVLPTPEQYHIGGQHNYYFSHMLNCIYDCRYCFLQGMYRSANYVVFVNYEDFFADIKAKTILHEYPSWYFSGYDCDSLALEPITQFVEHCLDAFSEIPQAWLELRTKSTQIRPLLKRPAIDNCVVAFSLSPEEIVQAEEHKTASLQKRIIALQQLQAHGWKIGLRFDPLIQASEFEIIYGRMFEQVLSAIDIEAVHSVSLGPFRLPRDFHRKMIKLYPDSKLLSAQLEYNGMHVSYPKSTETKMIDWCESTLLDRIAPAQYFPCVSS